MNFVFKVVLLSASMFTMSLSCAECSKAKNYADKAICSDWEISLFDKIEVMMYLDLIKNSDKYAKNKIIENQKI